MCIEKYFKDFLCDDDIIKCKALPNGNDNPLVYLFTQTIKDSSNSFEYTKYNVAFSYDIIKQFDFN